MPITAPRRWWSESTAIDKEQRMKLIAVLIFATVLPAATAASPKSDYMIHCMGCHRLDGQGMPPEVPAFDRMLGEIITRPEGRSYLIQVPGASQSPLGDEQLARVLTWILREFSSTSLPGDFQDISLQEVQKFRPFTLENPKLVRQKLLALTRN